LPTADARPTGVLLMTYGSAANADEVPAYLRSVRGGREPDPELVAEFQRRYRLIGWSPLIRITTEQAAAVQRLLDAEHGEGRYRVEAGMLHSVPCIDEAVGRLAVAGVGRLVGIVLSPQWSPVIMGGYRRALEAAAWRLGPGVELTVAGPWHRAPAFLDALAEKVEQALARVGPDVPVLFTAHSLPKAVVDRDPGYLDQIDAVVERVGLAAGRWRFAYQSAGHSPEEWLKPDLKDLLPGIRAAGHEAVLVVPVQFLADHLEILYDIDIAAREEAEAAGLAFHRIELMNTSPTFIRALAEVAVEQERAAQPAGS
jgi:protoporphyrin/coproporphyrin ferrochelatase